MKLAAVVLASLAALVDARVADACSPAPTCGDELCWGPIAVVDATIISKPTTENDRSSILVHVTNAWGETNGLPIGGNATLGTTQTFTDDDIGKSYVLYLERNDLGNLSILRTVDLADYQTTMCIGADATPESLATVALAPDCYHILTPVEPPPPRCPDGVTCSAGGALGGSPVALALAGLVARRRRRRT